MDLQVFTDMEAAMSWLSGLKGANQVQHYKTQSGEQIHSNSLALEDWKKTRNNKCKPLAD